MSEVLARLRVKEEHGIRRFLYPLMEMLDLDDQHINVQELNLITDAGEVLPCEWIDLNDGHEWLLQFAASLAPYETLELSLSKNVERVIVPDDLSVQTKDGILKTQQKRLAIEIGREGMPTSVVYDGVAHLRTGGNIQRNGETLALDTTEAKSGGHSLSAWVYAAGKYSDGSVGRTRTDTTACKSWMTVSHKFEQAHASDEISFFLPLAIISPVLTCDFGIGGGIFGKLQRGSAEEVMWRTEFEGETLRWSLATAGRIDYIGETSLKEFRSQQWFHLIDSDKALAVAITEVPASCQEMMVFLNTTGDVVITFRLGRPTGAVEFGVCYHFLNDIPAIAAATNPQSILLPPSVEVLPA